MSVPARRHGMSDDAMPTGGAYHYVTCTPYPPLDRLSKPPREGLTNQEPDARFFFVT